MDYMRIMADTLRRLASSKKHLILVLLLLLAHAFIFAHRNGWQDAQMPGDEPSYVEKAERFWRSNVYQRMTWSPEYVVLMSPFVGILGQEEGYKVWRFTLFASVSLLAYFAFARMFGSAWFGFVLALNTQLLWAPYASPSLQALAAVIILVCLLLLQGQSKNLGLVFGLLLNGIFVSGVINTIMSAFGALCLFFYARSLFCRRFFYQVSVGVAIFAMMVVSHSYDLTKYPEEALIRGRAGLHHQLSLFIFSSGRSSAYLNPEETVPNTYHGHLEAIERYYKDKFGNTEAFLRSQKMDEKWPAFLLNWPWLIEKDPELMRDYFYQEISTLVGSFYNAFQIILPVEKYDPNTTSRIRGNYHLSLIVVLTLPYLMLLGRKGSPSSLQLTWPSRLQLFFTLSTLAIFVPLMLINPLLIYFPPLIPAYLMGIALLSSTLVLGAGRLSCRLRKSP